MSKYEELTARLREMAVRERRMYKNFGLPPKDTDTMDQAADAIENLQKTVEAQQIIIERLKLDKAVNDETINAIETARAELQAENDRLNKENFWLSKPGDLYDEDGGEIMPETKCQRGGWISVKDRLPENMKNVLTYSKDCFVFIDFFLPAGGYFRNATFQGRTITHWMPLSELPEPPKEG